MIIPKDLPQFESKKSMLLITGKQHGLIYIANEGKIKKFLEIKIPKPKYSDREGHFLTSGKGKIYGSGSVYEDKDQFVIKKFLKKVNEDVNKIVKEEKIKAIYLFCPNHIKKLLLEEIKDPAKKIIKKKMIGNYVSSHPSKLLEKINDLQKDKKKKPKRKEVKKLLKKTV